MGVGVEPLRERHTVIRGMSVEFIDLGPALPCSLRQIGT